MKRVITAFMSTLCLSMLVAPGAKAIRPELVPKYSQPVVQAEEATPKPAKETAQDMNKLPAMERQEQQPSEQEKPQTPELEDSFKSFEQFYRDRYGS